MHKPRILVTGGAGYIGSHTIAEIKENTNWEVISLDNFVNSKPEVLDRLALIVGAEIRNENIDLRDLDLLNQFFNHNKFDGIIHFAALKSVPESVNNPLSYFDNNINGLLNLLSCSKEHNISNFIFSSSCSVYGNTEQLPVSEDTPWERAESPYARTKQIGEQIISDYSNSVAQTNFVSLRYFNPIGAHLSGLIGELPIGTPNNLVPYITQTAIGLREHLTVYGTDYATRDGTCIRDYIHVSDIANAHVLAMQRLLNKENQTKHEVFNLGSGNGVTVLEAIQAFEKVSNVKFNYHFGERRPGDVSAIYADNQKSNKILNWKIRYDVEQMMKSAWKWQLNYKGKFA